MKMFRFDPEIGSGAEQFGSVKAIISKVVNLESEAAINVAYIRPMERIGFHQAIAPQLFLLAEGEGWVRNETDEITPIREGQAVYWEKDEWHESGSETGMTAVIIEGVNFDPAKLMPLLQKDEP
jgi:quercetin dioxygenase-like cupin family protein